MPTEHEPDIDRKRIEVLLSALAEELEKDGDLRSPQWKAAVEQVPRHVFLPRFYLAQPNKQGVTEYRAVSPESCGVEEWLTRTYQNETWVTQLDHSDASWNKRGPVTGIPTSSSTLPGVVVRMLEDLHVSDTGQVLEVGTGTGYSTALLCARLGHEWVTSVEYDPAVSAAAGSRLASLGYRPTLVVGDGAAGHEPNAPYQWVIATCSFDHVPYAWITQASPAAIILTTLVGALGAYGYLRLTVTPGGCAAGHFMADETVSFMPSRALEAPRAATLLRPAYNARKETAEGRLSPLSRDTLSVASFLWAAQLFMPNVIQVGLGEDGTDGRWLLAGDGSWSCLETYPDRRVPQVFQGGPRRLWDELEAADRWWQDHDKPALNRYGASVTAADQYVWLDRPDSPDQWRLPS